MGFDQFLTTELSVVSVSVELALSASKNYALGEGSGPSGYV